MSLRLALASFAALFACTSSSSPAQVTVENAEDVPLFALMFDPVGSDTSTTNLLGAKMLGSGATLALDVPCGVYDVQVEVAGGDLPPGAGMCLIKAQDVCATEPFVISSANCLLAE